MNVALNANVRGWRQACVHLAAAIVIIAGTIASLRPVLDNDFVNWGDVQDITSNENYRGFGQGKLTWMATTIQMGHWQPLSWMTLALDYEIAGMNPRQYHFSSLLYHATASVLVYFLVLSLLRAVMVDIGTRRWIVIAAALAGALLFAVHPLRVEPVAWATERRGPVSAIFYFGALITYLAYARRLNQPSSAARTAMYWLAVGCMVLSLLAKEFGVSLPAVLLAIDIYPLRRLNWSLRSWLRPAGLRVVLEKTPFVLVAALGTVIALAAAAQSGVAKSVTDYGVLQRVMQACHGLIFYLNKTFWPMNLSNLYPIPPAMNPLDGRFLIAAAASLLITIVLLLWRNRWPAGLVTWCCYIIILLPVLGLVQTGRQIAADRYMYLPAAGVSALAAGAILLLWRKSQPGMFIRAARLAIFPAAGIVLLLLGRAAHQQSRVWRNSMTLWSHALIVDPQNAVAHNNMAVLLSERDDVAGALGHLNRAIAIDPNYVEAMTNLGALYAQQGAMDAAIAQWSKTLEIDPAHAAAREHLRRASTENR